MSVAGEAPSGALGSPVEGAEVASSAPVVDETGWIDVTAVASSPSEGAHPVAQLALGENHSCALSRAGRVQCWGYNEGGTLGVGVSGSPAIGKVEGVIGTVRALEAGGYQTCAITDDGSVWCWGSNRVGQAGAAPSLVVSRPTRVAGLTDVQALYAGDQTTCALDARARVSCWGGNTAGQISASRRTPVTVPTRVPAFDGATLLAVGNYHACALVGGRVVCTGELAPLNAQLATLTQVSALSAGWGHSCAATAKGVYCWGKSYLGVLGLGNPCAGQGSTCDTGLHGPRRVPGLAAGVRALVGRDYHTCALTASRQVVCWGNNQGHRFSRALPAEPWQTPHVVFAARDVDAVHVGGVHTCIVQRGTARCLGNDWAGAVTGKRSPKR